MQACDCKNSRTGRDKRKYASHSEADRACHELRKLYIDGETLNSYYCFEGRCWHVGNRGESYEEEEQNIPGETPGGWHSPEADLQNRMPRGVRVEREPESKEVTNPMETFLDRLAEDARPQADALRLTARRIVNSTAVQSCARLGYKGLVGTIGVGLALSQPAARATKRLAAALWKSVERAAEDK